MSTYCIEVWSTDAATVESSAGVRGENKGRYRSNRTGQTVTFDSRPECGERVDFERRSGSGAIEALGVLCSKSNDLVPDVDFQCRPHISHV